MGPNSFNAFQLDSQDRIVSAFTSTKDKADSQRLYSRTLYRLSGGVLLNDNQYVVGTKSGLHGFTI